MAKATGSHDLTSLKQELIKGAALVAGIGLVPLTQGNLSLRDRRKRACAHDAARLPL